MQHLKQCLGVDLGVNTVKIVELALDKNAVRTIRAASAPTGANPSMSSEEIRSAIITAAKELIKKARFSARKAVFSISGQSVFIRRFRLPKTSEERLARIVQYEARQQIPFPLEKAVLQFQFMEFPDQGEVEVLLVAMRNEVIRDFMGMVGKIGLQPVAVGVSSFALFNAQRFLAMDAKEAANVFLDLNPKKKGGKGSKSKVAAAASAAAGPSSDTVALDAMPEEEFSYEEVKGYVNLGAATLDLAIGRSGRGGAMIGFSRTVPMGGDEMTRAVMRASNVESFSDAERIKASSTQLMTFNFDYEGDGQINQEASMAVTEVADKMATEIRRSLEFFISQPDGMAIDSLVLSGGQVLLPGFDEYIKEKLAVEVSIVKQPAETSPLKWNDAAGPVTPYVIAIGLALQGIGLGNIRVDFLPEERKITRDFPYKVTALMVVILMSTTAIVSNAGANYAAIFQREADSIRGKMVSDKANLDLFTATQAEQDAVAAQYTSLSKVFGQRTFWMDFMSRLATIKPPEVVLRDVQCDHSGRVSIEGMSQAVVAAANLRKAIDQEFGDEIAPDLHDPNSKSVIEDIRDITSPPPPFTKGASAFKIGFTLKTKINHLQIYPTPSPGVNGAYAPAPAQPGSYGIPGVRGGYSSAPQPGAGSGK